MSEVSDLLKHAFEKSPVEFADTFNTLMRQKAVDAVEAHRVTLAQSIYGAPEDDADIEGDEVDTEDEFDIDNDEVDTDDFDDDDFDLDDIDLDDLDDEGNTDEDA